MSGSLVSTPAGIAALGKISAATLIALLVGVSSPATSYADAGLLRTIHALDEVRGYCLDIAGEGQTLRLDDARCRRIRASTEGRSTINASSELQTEPSARRCTTAA